MGVCGRQDENDVRRRLFKCFEEGIGALTCNHMDFVDYVDFVAEDIGRVIYPLLEIVHVIDAAVAGLVYLNDIQSAASVDGRARFAAVAGFTFDGILAVYRFGQDARRACFAAAARAAEQIGVGNPITLNCIAEGLDYVFLAGYFAECLGTPFTVKNLGSHGALIIPQPPRGLKWKAAQIEMH